MNLFNLYILWIQEKQQGRFPRSNIMKHTTSGLSENMYSASIMCSSGAPLLLVPNSADHLDKIAAKPEILLRGTNNCT